MAVTATVAIAATMSVSAFAADVTVAPTDDKVSVTPTAVDGATMYTVMVFGCAADADIATAVPADANAIYYINQDTDATALVTNMLVKATSETEYLPAGNYVVRIGNDKGSVQNFALESKVAESGEDTSNSIVVYWGDVTGDGAFSGADVSAVKMKSIDVVESAKTVKDVTEGSEKTLSLSMGDKVQLTVNGTTVVFYWGDVNGDGTFSGADVSAVKMKSIDVVESAKTIKDVTEGSELSVSVAMGDAVTISPYAE